MMRTRFDEQLSLLNRELIEMGALCEQAIATLSSDEQAAIFGGNACAVYRLQETSNESAFAK